MNEKKTGFFIRMALGALIGLALIVPGFSGGTIAVIVGIYDELISAISNLFKKFKESFLYLLPIVIGAVLSIAALVFPIRLGFEYVPLEMTCLFVGLMLGGCGPVIKKLKSGFSPIRIIPFALALLFAVGICFIPSFDILSGDLVSFIPIIFIFVVGIVSSSGFIVPGISGSMIALIFGVYPIVVSSLSEIISLSFSASDFAVFVPFILGAIVGVFLISFIMKALLKKFELGTYYAIAGFILGSLFSIFYTQETLITDFLPLAAHIAIALAAAAIGFVVSFIIALKAGKINREEQA